MKRVVSIIAVLVVLPLFSFGQQREKTFPDIELIMADDMGYECLSANGSISSMEDCNSNKIFRISSTPKPCLTTIFLLICII